MGWRFRGSHRFICDRCRLEYTSDQKRKEWNGAVVCQDCWEPRHPSDLYRTPKEDTSVPDPRPDTAVVYVATSEEWPIFTLTDENDNPIQDENENYIQVPKGVIS